MSLSDMCQQSIKIEKCAVAQGDMGGEVRTYSLRSVGGIPLGGIAASIQRPKGTVTDQFQRRGIAISHTIYTEHDLSEVAIGDRVTDEESGEKYLVHFPDNMGAQDRAWALHVEVIR